MLCQAELHPRSVEHDKPALQLRIPLPGDPITLSPSWACSSAWLERIPDKDEVPGSNPGRPTSEDSSPHGVSLWSAWLWTSRLRHICVTIRDATWLKRSPRSSDGPGMAPVLDDQLLSVAEAADYLSMSQSTVRRYLRRREIEHIRVGRTVRIRRSVLEAWLREHTQMPTDYAALI